VLVRYYQMTI